MSTCDHEVEFVQRLAEVEARGKSNTIRLDKLEGITTAVHELATSMSLMAERQAHIARNMDNLTEKMIMFEAKPGKRWESVVEKVITAFVAGAVGFVMAALGLSA